MWSALNSCDNVFCVRPITVSQAVYHFSGKSICTWIISIRIIIIFYSFGSINLNCLWIELSMFVLMSIVFILSTACVRNAIALNRANKMIKACYKCKYTIWWYNSNTTKLRTRFTRFEHFMSLTTHESSCSG